MINYDAHLQFMDREVQKAWDALDGLLAERQGVRDAKVYPTPQKQYATTMQTIRYGVGFEIGKAKLMQEEPCAKMLNT